MSGIVPAIVQVNRLPNGKVSIRANVPVKLDVGVTNCSGPINGQSVDVICDIDSNVLNVITAE